MYKKIILVITIIFSLPQFVQADILINEIMYSFYKNDKNKEWIEVYNDSNASVDISKYSFFEADTNHRFELKQGSAKIPAKGYAVIVNDLIGFKSDWVKFPGTIFDSSFSLSNSGETLAIKNGEKIIDEVAYQSSMGADADGKSLQKINGKWVAAFPTPGAQNKIFYTTPSTTTSTTKTSTQPISSNNNQNIDTQIPTTPSENVPDASSGGTSSIFVVIFVILVSLAGGAVYFLRKKKVNAKNGGSFKLLD